uniref:Uncharacterized protein n=1 Tax=Arundo donax TaxID=35708 RepID=A0A0A9CC59_ARUDO
MDIMTGTSISKRNINKKISRAITS